MGDEVFITFRQGAVDLGAVTEQELDDVFQAIREDSTMSNRACTFSASLAGPANEMGSFSKVPRTHVFSLVSKFEKITSDGVTAENVEVSAGNFTNLLSPKHVNIATSYCKSAPAMGGGPCITPCATIVVEIFTNAETIEDNFVYGACTAIRDAIQCHILCPRNLNNIRILFLLSNFCKMCTLDEAQDPVCSERQ